MTGPYISNAFKVAASQQNTTEVWITLLTISHPSFTDDVRISDDPTGVLPIAGVRGTVSNGLEYVFCPFTIQLPPQNETGVAQAEISVDNVGEELMRPIREADSAVDVKVQIILASTPDHIEKEYDNLQLQVVNYDALNVSGSLGMEWFELEPYPSGRYTPSTAPGVF